MTIIDLIRKLITLPPDMEVVVQRSGQKREMRIFGVIRRDVVQRTWAKPAHEVELLCDWKGPK